jgi:hypothetical protein
MRPSSSTGAVGRNLAVPCKFTIRDLIPDCTARVVLFTESSLINSSNSDPLLAYSLSSPFKSRTACGLGREREGGGRTGRGRGRFPSQGHPIRVAYTRRAQSACTPGDGSDCAEPVVVRDSDGHRLEASARRTLQPHEEPVSRPRSCVRDSGGPQAAPARPRPCRAEHRGVGGRGAWQSRPVTEVGTGRCSRVKRCAGWRSRATGPCLDVDSCPSGPAGPYVSETRSRIAACHRANTRAPTAPQPSCGARLRHGEGGRGSTRNRFHHEQRALGTGVLTNVEGLVRLPIGMISCLSQSGIAPMPCTGSCCAGLDGVIHVLLFGEKG